MFLTFAKIWQTAATYSPETFSVTAAVVAPAVAICLNSLLISLRLYFTGQASPLIFVPLLKRCYKVLLNKVCLVLQSATRLLQMLSVEYSEYFTILEKKKKQAPKHYFF